MGVRESNIGAKFVSIVITIFILVSGGVADATGDTTPPTITIKSPTNNSKTNENIFDVEFGEIVNWSAYSIDNGQNITTGNVSLYTNWTALSGLSKGQHNLTVYANDSSGNMNSSVVILTRTLQTYSQEIITNFDIYLKWPDWVDNDGSIRYGNDSSKIYRGATDFNTSSIPDSTVITNIVFRANVNDAMENNDNATFAQMKDTANNYKVNDNKIEFIYDVAEDGFYSPHFYQHGEYNTTGWKNTTLYYAALDDAMAQLSADWFTIGFHSQEGTQTALGAFYDDTSTGNESRIVVTGITTGNQKVPQGNYSGNDDDAINYMENFRSYRSENSPNVTEEGFWAYVPMNNSGPIKGLRFDLKLNDNNAGNVTWLIVVHKNDSSYGARGSLQQGSFYYTHPFKLWNETYLNLTVTHPNVALQAANFSNQDDIRIDLNFTLYPVEHWYNTSIYYVVAFNSSVSGSIYLDGTEYPITNEIGSFEHAWWVVNNQNAPTEDLNLAYYVLSVLNNSDVFSFYYTEDENGSELIDDGAILVDGDYVPFSDVNVTYLERVVNGKAQTITKLNLSATNGTYNLSYEAHQNWTYLILNDYFSSMPMNLSGTLETPSGIKDINGYSIDDAAVLGFNHSSVKWVGCSFGCQVSDNGTVNDTTISSGDSIKITVKWTAFNSSYPVDTTGVNITYPNQTTVTIQGNLESGTNVSGIWRYEFSDTNDEGTYNVQYFLSNDSRGLYIRNSSTITFTVDTTSPTITLISPQNTTINDTPPDLNLTTDEPANITYSWDSEATISGCRNCDSYSTTYGENNGSDPNTVLLMHMNENNGTAAYDDVSNNDGTINGTTWSSGRFGPALDFNETGDFVSVSDSQSLDTNGAFTLTAWIYSRNSTDVQRIISKIDTSSEWQGYHFDLLKGANSMKLRCMSHNKTSSNYGNMVSNDSLTMNEWHFVACVRDTSAGKMELYVDGEPAASPAADNSVNKDIINDKPMLIGAREDGAKYFNGTIDETAIYSRALSEAEIRELYNKTLSTGQQHSVTVWATDVEGNQNSTTKYFTVE